MKSAFIVLGLMAVLALPGCKIIKNASEGEGTAVILEGEEGDDARIAALLEKTYEAELLPLIANALPVTELRRAVAGGCRPQGRRMATGGRARGGLELRSEGRWEGGRGEPDVARAESDGRCRQRRGSGPDVAAGDVIKGTSLRDVAPFYRFGGFRDQIEFARLARAPNDRASAGFQVPEGDPVGKTVSIIGTVDLKAAGDPWLVIAVTLSVAP